MRANGPRLSYSESLKEIEEFGVKIARSLEGGKVTEANHPSGDLYHPERQAFSEVKTSMTSAGPIICEEQLGRHYEGSEQHDRQYIFVMYEGREWRDGKYRYLPIRMGKKGQNVLRRFLARKLRKVYVFHVSVVWAIYQHHLRKGDVQEYMMQRGLKRYIKIPDADLRRIAVDPSVLSEYGLEPSNYTLNCMPEMAQFRQFRIPTEVVRLSAKDLLDILDESGF